MPLSRFTRGRTPDLTQAVSRAPRAAHPQGVMSAPAQMATASSGQLCPGWGRAATQMHLHDPPIGQVGPLCQRHGFPKCTGGQGL